MKTLHRLVYETVTPEEYKEFCKVDKSRFFIGKLTKYKDGVFTDRGALINTFDWGSYNTHYDDDPAYWQKLCVKYSGHSKDQV